MTDGNSSYPRIETGYAYTEDMNDEVVEKLNNGNFTKGSAILKINTTIEKFNRSTPSCERERKEN